MRNVKRLQGQDRQSIMSEKLVGGVEGRPGADQDGGGEHMTQGYSSHLYLRKRPPSSGAVGKARSGRENHSGIR